MKHKRAGLSHMIKLLLDLWTDMEVLKDAIDLILFLEAMTVMFQKLNSITILM